MKNPNELSATSSWRGNELQLIEQKANIVVGVANSRTRLRIGVLLSSRPLECAFTPNNQHINI